MKNTKKTAKINIMPLGDRILIKPIVEMSEKTKSGIYIPESVQKEKPEDGTVIAVGEGKYEHGILIKPRIQVGDTVMFSKYGYDEVKIDGEEYFIIKEENILAIIK